MKLLDKCKSITYLNISDCRNITFLGIKAFVKTHAKVTKLVLNDSMIDDEGVSYIMTGLKRLESLEMRNCVNLSDFSLVAIGERPFNFTPLKKLDLRDNHRFTDKVRHIYLSVNLR
jgi:hypothetical protein